jgi:hypothetical protein
MKPSILKKSLTYCEFFLKILDMAKKSLTQMP